MISNRREHISVKRYGISRVLPRGMEHAEETIAAATADLYEQIQQDGQAQCHQIQIAIVAYVEVDTLPARLAAGIIAEHLNVLTVETPEYGDDDAT